MIYISTLLAFLITCLFIWSLTPVAHKIKLVDKPGGRKKHSGNIPLIGGIAMYVGLLVGLFVLDFPLSEMKGLLVASAILLAVGTIDDYVDLKASTRFLAQISAALIIIFVDNIVLVDLGQLFGNGAVELGWFSTLFTMVAIVGVINATNMSDGMDGLAGGLAFIAISALAIAASGIENSLIGSTAPVVLAIFAAFLLFNMRSRINSQAKIFMGNGGSMFLGLLLAWYLIGASQGEAKAITPATALWIFAIPLLDTVCIMIRRIVKGRSPFAPDREHFHHILLVAGYSVKHSVWIMNGIAGLLATLGLMTMFSNIPEQIVFTGMLSMFALYFWGMSHAWKVMKVIRLDRGPNGPVDSSAK